MKLKKILMLKGIWTALALICEKRQKQEFGTSTKGKLVK